MLGPEQLSTTATKQLRASLRISNAIYNFIVIVLLGLVLGQLFAPEFLPEFSIRIIAGFAVSLAIIGTYLSVMLARRMVRSIEHFSGSLDRVLGVTRQVREELHQDVLLDKILDFAIQLSGSEAGSVLFCEGDELVFKVAKGTHADGLVGKRISRSKGLSGWVSEHGDPMYVLDAQNNEVFNVEVDKDTGFVTRSLLCVPLITKSGIIGVLELINKVEGQYDDKVVELISYLAEQAAVSIERAEFYEDQRNYETHITDILVKTIDFVLPETSGHSRRVAQYSGLIARAVDMDEQSMRNLHFACLLHDIGSLLAVISDEHKDLTHDKHSLLGAESLASINFYKDIAPIVRHQTERFDESGQPDGLGGSDIPLESRILAIAESFDMFLNRGEGCSEDDAFEGLRRHSETRLDPGLVELFIKEYLETLD